MTDESDAPRCPTCGERVRVIVTLGRGEIHAGPCGHRVSEEFAREFREGGGDVADD